jgi:hypothetical protein
MSLRIGGRMTAVLLLLVTPIVLFVQLEPLSPGPATIAQNEQDPKNGSITDAKSDDRSSDNSPASLNRHDAKEHDGISQHERNDKKAKPSSEWGTVSDWATVALGIAMLIVTYYQWKILHRQTAILEKQTDHIEKEMLATQKAAKATEETVNEMRLERRAWLCLGNPDCGEIMGALPVEWTLDVENTGMTPATIKREYLAYHVIKPGGPSLDENIVTIEKDMCHLPLIEKIVAPGSTIEMLAESTKSIDQEDVSDINQQISKAFLIVRIEYWDSLKCERHTQGCFRYRPHQGFVMHNRYNVMA